MMMTADRKSRKAAKIIRNRLIKHARFESITGMKYPNKASTKRKALKNPRSTKPNQSRPSDKRKSSKTLEPTERIGKKTLIKPLAGKENSNGTGPARHSATRPRPLAPLPVIANHDFDYDADSDLDSPVTPGVKICKFCGGTSCHIFCNNVLGSKKQAATRPYPRATKCLECGGDHHIDDHRDSRVDGRVPYYRFFRFGSLDEPLKTLMVCAKCGGDHSMFVHYGGDGDLGDNYLTDDDRRGNIKRSRRQRDGMVMDEDYEGHF